MIGFAFDDQAEAAVKAAEEHAARLVKDITAETEANIRALIAQAIHDGIPPNEAADAIADLVGLTAAQGQAALKYRDTLVANGLDPAKVDQKTSEYADELLADRAETIARTEVMDALNAGQEDAWLQAQDEGLLSADATKVWIGTEGECEECVAMDGETTPIGDEFPGGDPPLHPRCRCTTGIADP